MKPPYTPEEERKIELVRKLMENAYKEMERAYEAHLEESGLRWLLETKVDAKR